MDHNSNTNLSQSYHFRCYIYKKQAHSQTMHFCVFEDPDKNVSFPRIQNLTKLAAKSKV